MQYNAAVTAADNTLYPKRLRQQQQQLHSKIVLAHIPAADVDQLPCSLMP
jgi:hypothetical protein